jgi:hypothetical protein
MGGHSAGLHMDQKRKNILTPMIRSYSQYLNRYTNQASRLSILVSKW